MTVIRDAVIRVRTEREKAALEGPSGEMIASQKESIKLTKEQTQAVQELGFHSAREYAHIGHGVLQLARGFALMSASGEESTRKLLEMFVAIEAGTSIVRGAVHVTSGLIALFGGPLGKAIAAVAAVVAAGVVIWKRYVNAQEEAEKQARETAKAIMESAKAYQESLRAARGLERDFGEMRVRAELEPGGRQRAAQRELAREQGIIELETERAASLQGKGRLTGAEMQDLLGAEQRRVDALKRQVDLLHELANTEMGAIHQGPGLGDLFSSFGGSSRFGGRLESLLDEGKIRSIQQEYTKALQEHIDRLQEATEQMRKHQAATITTE